MRSLVVVCLAALPALGGEHKVAVAPIEGVLGRADAAAVEEAVRAEVRGLDLEVIPGTPAGLPAAADLGATHAITGKAVRLEGALAIILTLVKVEDGAKLGMERLVGYTHADLQREAKKKVPRLLRAGLGIAAPAESTATPAATPTPTPARSATPLTAARPTANAIATSTAPPTPIAPPTATTTARSASISTSESTPALPKPKPGPRFVRAPTQITGIEESSPLVRTIRQVVEDVEDVRGLWRKTTLQVVLLDDALFSKALRSKAEKELTKAAVAAERARWAAFGLAPPDADPARILLGVLDEQVAGFYDPSSKALTVREKPPGSAGASADAFQLVLAHEVEHALQDQHFGFPDLEKLPDDDARLARMALYEGDAMATMVAVGARRAGRPVKLALGTDNTSCSDAQNMFQAMKLFALFAGEGGQKAFAAATVGGAEALGLADEIGRIAPGRKADITLLNLRDPAFVPLNDAVRHRCAVIFDYRCRRSRAKSRSPELKRRWKCCAMRMAFRISLRAPSATRSSRSASCTRRTGCGSSK